MYTWVNFVRTCNVIVAHAANEVQALQWTWVPNAQEPAICDYFLKVYIVVN